MIAVDSSAVIAVIQSGPEEARLRAALHQASRGLISTASLLEIQIVMAGKGSTVSWPDIEALLRTYRVAPHPFDERQLTFAREAALRFGKGRHKAGLNLTDCFSYALARSQNLPLLCTGRDFAHTDIELA